ALGPGSRKNAGANRYLISRRPSSKAILRPMSSQERWIKSRAASSLNPDQVELALAEMASHWQGSLEEFLRNFPLGEKALIHLLAVSSICAGRLQRQPELLHWLAQPEVSDRKSTRLN